MNGKLKLGLVSLLAIAAFAVIPAAAQSFVTKWEVSLPGPYKVLPPGTPETLNSKAAFGLSGKRASGVGIKTTCVGTDTETIENELAFPEEGIDEMTSFELSCGEVGPDPCVTGETFKVIGGASLPWFSELVLPSNDAFEGVEVEVKCNVSGLTMLYHPPGHLWNPKIGVNALKSSLASGIFKHVGGRSFWLEGTDKLVPTLYKKVR